MSRNRVRRAGGNAGMAQLTAVIFISVAALVIVAVATRQLQQFRLVERHEEFQICFDGVESARLHSVAILEGAAAGGETTAPPTGVNVNPVSKSSIGPSSTKGAAGGGRRRQRRQRRPGNVGPRLRQQQPDCASPL